MMNAYFMILVPTATFLGLSLVGMVMGRRTRLLLRVGAWGRRVVALWVGLLTVLFGLGCLYVVSMSYGGIGEFVAGSWVDLWDHLRLGYWASDWAGTAVALTGAASPGLVAGGIWGLVTALGVGRRDGCS
jgi:hypothetical protein